MSWTVRFHDAFEGEFEGLHEDVQDEILSLMGLLKEFGPRLGRPRADTLKGSAHANMKELRFDAADGVWRVAFAFDPSGRRYCWSRATSPAAARSAFTSG